MTTKWDFVAVFFAFGLLGAVVFFIQSKQYYQGKPVSEIATSPDLAPSMELEAGDTVANIHSDIASIQSTNSILDKELANEIAAMKAEIAEINSDIAARKAETAAIESKLRAEAAERFKDDPEFLKRFNENLDRSREDFDKLDGQLERAQKELQRDF